MFLGRKSPEGKGLSPDLTCQRHVSQQETLVRGVVSADFTCQRHVSQQETMARGVLRLLAGR